MARFSQIQQGKRARRVVAFPMLNTRCPLLVPLPELEAQRLADAAERGATKSGGDAPTAPEDENLVALVVLNGEEETRSLELARAAAIKAGVTDPKPNEPIYDLQVMVHTLLFGCVDNESPIDAPVPFFSSAEQIMRSLSRDQITHLFAQHEFWQDEISPRAKNTTEDDFMRWLTGVAESESPSDFFELVGPATLWRYVHTLIKLLALSPTDRSPVGSTTDSSGKSSTTPTVKISDSTEGAADG
jgi:hypothetical protein